jgi:hypothetical protein
MRYTNPLVPTMMLYKLIYDLKISDSYGDLVSYNTVYDFMCRMKVKNEKI